METITPLEKLRASTNVISDQEYKEAFVNVSHVASEILARTLGPYAHTTIIDDGAYRYSTKDGWSIANRIVFTDTLANSLFSFIKTISFNLVSKVGDGTTTAIVASDKFIRAMSKNKDLKKYRQRDLLKLLEIAKTEIVNTLKDPDQNFVHMIDPKGDFSDICRIAYTSTNGNAEIADMIQEIYQETENSNIYVNIGNDLQTTMEIQTGYRFDCAPVMLKNYTNTDTKEFKTDVGNAKAIFFNHNVSYVIHRRLLEEIFSMIMDAPGFRNLTIVLFAPYFDDTISGAINQANNRFVSQGLNPPIMMIQTPMTTTLQKHLYNDFRAVTGNIFMEEQTVELFNRLKNPEQFTEESTEAFRKNFQDLGAYLGCREIIVDYLKPLDHCTVGKDFILVEKYDTDSEEYKKVFQDAKEAYEEQLKESGKRMTDLDREFMNASLRYTRIYGRMGIINVGGASELERKCLKDSVDDAVLAARSAFENGYVAGMNLSTLSAIQHCKNICKNNDVNMIFDMLFTAFKETDYEIIRNMRPDWTDEDIDKYLCPVIQSAISNKTGYDLVEEKIELPDQLTVINSVNTDIEILNSVVSILGYALTSNQMISINRSFDRSVMTKIKEADEYEKYYRIGKSIAEAMKDMKLFMTSPIVKLDEKNCDPGFDNTPYKEFDKEIDIHRSIKHDGPITQILLQPGTNPLLDPVTGEPKPATCRINTGDYIYNPDGSFTTATNIIDNTVK